MLARLERAAAKVEVIGTEVAGGPAYVTSERVAGADKAGLLLAWGYGVVNPGKRRT